MSIRITGTVWADDDCRGVLRFLGRSLSRRGLKLQRFESWTQAYGRLRQECQAKEASPLSLLVDVILPKSNDGEALDPYLGLDLAHLAATCGVQRICFLTVIPREEIKVRFLKLQEEFSATTFLYEDKLELLEKGKIDYIVSFLKGENRKEEV